MIHLNDWHMGATLAALDGSIPSVLSLHNIAYQGFTDGAWLPHLGPRGWHYEWFGGTNPLSGAIALADAIVAVSPTHAAEILTAHGGFGLDGALRHRWAAVSGILNGIDTDVWNPDTDAALVANYAANTKKPERTVARAANRAAIRERARSRRRCAAGRRRLPADWPEGGRPARADRADPSLDPAAPRRPRVGEANIAEALATVAEAEPEWFCFVNGYDDPFAHLLHGGADLLLVPSRFEPCGLTQMQAMRYGAIPVVTDVGGLHDTVADADEDSNGTGFRAPETTSVAFTSALFRAARHLATARARATLSGRGMKLDWSWSGPAREYAALYQRLIGDAEWSAPWPNRDPRDHPRRGRGQATATTHQRPGQTGRAVCRQLPADRLRLSNFANAGLLKMVVLTQYKSHSLDRHVSQTWRFSTLLGQYVTPVPAQMRRGPFWFSGSADAIYQNLNLISDENPDLVCVFGADHIYRMDPQQMIDHHVEVGAGVTVAAIPVPKHEAREFGVIESDADGRILDFHEKVEEPPTMPGDDERCLASMGNYVFDTQTLIDVVTPREHVHRPRRPRDPSAHQGGRRPRLRLLAQRRARAGRPRARLLARRRDDRLVLHRQHGPDRPAAGVQPVQQRVAGVHVPRSRPSGEGVTWPGWEPAYVDGCLLCQGSIVSGAHVERSIIAPGCYVSNDAHVTDSILFPGVRVGVGARLHRCIIDKNVEVPDWYRIGHEPDKDRELFTVSDSGIAVIEKDRRL